MPAPRNAAPRQAIMTVSNVPEEELQAAAMTAVERSRSYLPRVTGAAAASLFAIWGEDWFGVEWTHDSIWFQEAGIRPFTMRSLAGKVVPMWVKDGDGSERRKNPKIETRVRQDTGETEVLIFRRAAKQGERKQVVRTEAGRQVVRDVPRSYPGAPGRIAVNRSRGIMRVGDVNPHAANPGQIAQRNVGVRWRHPGLEAGKYVLRGVADAAEEHGYPVGEVHYLPAGTAYVGARYDLILVRL